MNRKRWLFTVKDEYGEVWFQWSYGYDRADAAERLYDQIETRANPGYRFWITPSK